MILKRNEEKKNEGEYAPNSQENNVTKHQMLR